MKRKAKLRKAAGDLVAMLGPDLDGDFIITYLSSVLQADIADIIDPQTGAYRPVHEWPPIWRQMLTGCDVKEEFQRSHDGMIADEGEGLPGDRRAWDKAAEVKKIKFLDKLRALELFGKLKEIDRFVGAKNEINVNLNVNEKMARLEAGRQRAKERDPSAVH